MALSRKEALNQLQNMFPTYDRSALNTLLRANENMLNQTIDYILQLNEEEQKKLQENEQANQINQDNFRQEEENKQNQDENEEEDDQEESAFAEKPEKKKSNPIPEQKQQQQPSQPAQSQLSKEEEEKKSRELIDQLLAMEMQEQYADEASKYEQIVQENYAIEEQIQSSSQRRQGSSSNNNQNNNNNRQSQSQQQQVRQNRPSQQQQQNNQKNDPKNQKKQEESIGDKAEKTVNKIGAFFKKGFQKIEDQLVNLDKPKSDRNSVKEKRPASDKQVVQAAQREQNFSSYGEEMIYKEPQPNMQKQNSNSNANAQKFSPVRVPRDEDASSQNEVIEEIVFIHPQYTSPSTYYKSLFNTGRVANAKGSLNDVVENIDFGIPDLDHYRRNQ